MKKENLYLPFEVRVRRYDRFPVTEHQHSFFELCYIVSGTGDFISGNQIIPFSGTTMFFIRPQISHTYRLSSMCDIIYIRLTDAYIGHVLNATEKDLLYLPLPLDLYSLVRQEDKEHISLLMKCISAEYLSLCGDTSRIASHWINSILLIYVRNIRHQFGDAVSHIDQESKLMPMLQYIEMHLNNPDLLRTKELGRQFNLAENYIGKFFKVHTGESLQQYILQCRIKFVKELLSYTDFRISEIVFKAGFSDESHLTHTFKRITGLTPLEYRKKGRC